MNDSPKGKPGVRIRSPKRLADKACAERPGAKAAAGGTEITAPVRRKRSDKAPASPLVLTPRQAWTQLCARTGGGIALRAFYEWIKYDKIYSVRLGGRIFIPIDDLEDLIQRCLRGDRT